MNVRDLNSLKSRQTAWHALNAAEPPEERIVTLGWLCMAATLVAALLAAAYTAY